jgi:hypothetical protein
MKNIHILPTDKPSRFIHNNSNQLCYQSNKSFKNDRKNRKKFNIYITSDEEIKEKDWCYYENGDLKGIHKVVNGQKPKTMILRKIILTTDHNLIKDGIQPIDDEFLEWFVKNPSCEEVEVDKPISRGIPLLGYRIIIPQENLSNKH